MLDLEIRLCFREICFWDIIDVEILFIRLEIYRLVDIQKNQNVVNVINFNGNNEIKGILVGLLEKLNNIEKLEKVIYR